MSNRMFPFGIAAILLVSSGGCAVVGYPAPLREPATVRAVRRAEATVASAAVRTYEVFGRTYTTLATSEGYVETGIASWYGEPYHGRATASGETFDMHALTAAHRTLPLSTCVEVRRLDDDRRVRVRVNDRGPFDDDERRIIDLSYAAGSALGLTRSGTTEVQVRSLEVGTSC